MNDRRLKRLKQLAQGAALVGASVLGVGCEKHATADVPSPMPTPPGNTGTPGAEPGRRMPDPVKLNAPLTKTPEFDAGAPVGDPVPTEPPVYVNSPGERPAPVVHVNAPPPHPVDAGVRVPDPVKLNAPLTKTPVFDAGTPEEEPAAKPDAGARMRFPPINAPRPKPK